MHLQHSSYLNQSWRSASCVIMALFGSLHWKPELADKDMKTGKGRKAEREALVCRAIWNSSYNKGLTLAPFSGKHLQPPLQSLPPQGPLYFFPPCQTQSGWHESQNFGYWRQGIHSTYATHTCCCSRCQHKHGSDAFLIRGTRGGKWLCVVCVNSCDCVLCGFAV